MTRITLIEKRMVYNTAKGKLLQFFLEHMYSNNTELFNKKNDAFLNDKERMKYFIDRFNQHYIEEMYFFIAYYYPPDADEHSENHNPDAVESSYIHELMMAITFIKQYHGL